MEPGYYREGTYSDEPRLDDLADEAYERFRIRRDESENELETIPPISEMLQ